MKESRNQVHEVEQDIYLEISRVINTHGGKSILYELFEMFCGIRRDAAAYSAVQP